MVKLYVPREISIRQPRMQPDKSVGLVKWQLNAALRTMKMLALLVVLLMPTMGFGADYALIIGGVGGEKSFYDAFWSATSRFHQLLADEYGYSPEQITFLFEDEGDIPGLVDAAAKREPILAAFAQLAEKMQPPDRFLLFMMGHASRSSQGLKFNLPGRDISETEYADSINRIPAAQKILIFGFPYSARFVPRVSAPETIILTSSSRNEGYSLQAGFGDALVDAFSTATADTNSDGAVSLLEAFLWLQEQTKAWYENDGSVQSEHPHLDDNGDRNASRKDLEDKGEGALAAETFLGKRRSPLPVQDEPTELADAMEEGRGSLLLDSQNHAHNRRPGNSSGAKDASSIPYDFISEADEDAIQTAIQNMPEAEDYPDAGAVVLWEAVEVDIDEASKHIYSTRRIVRIFNENGYGLGEISIPYMRGRDDVTIHHARTLTPDGEIIKLNPAEILRDIPPPSAVEAGLYVDARLMYFTMPELTPGCIIDYAYSTNNLGHVMQGEFWRQVYFQTSVPVLSYRFRAHIPKKKELHYVVKGQVEGTAIEPTLTENNYTRTYTFKAHDVPPLTEEYLMPAPQDLAYNISISSLASWDKLVTWYATLIREQDTITPDIEAKTEELLRGAWSRREKIRRLYEYVATQIRYLGFELGIWAIKPYPAAAVLKEGRGDCKDKTTLLSTMLKHAGIASYPVLISAGDSREIVKEIPSLAYFNHMILAVEGEKDDEFLWLDATAETCAFGDFPANDQDRWTLIINPDFLERDDESGRRNESSAHSLANQLYLFQKSPVLDAASNIKRVDTRVQVKKDRGVTVRQELKVTGSFNTKLRSKLSRFSTKEEQAEFLHKTLELDERAKVEEFKISGLHELKRELKVTLTWTCEEYLYAIGSQFVLELPLIKHPYAELLSEEQRTHPAVIGKALVFEDKISVHADAPFVIDTVPAAQTLKTDVAEIELAYAHSKRKAEMRQTVSFYTPRVEPSQIMHLKDVVRIASNRGPKRFILRRLN